MASFDHERPSWADSSLSFCGFTWRGVPGPDAVTNETQVHGAVVHVVDSATRPTEGDGLWTKMPGLKIGVRVADCVPILLYDPGLPAVAAVHAGWRGTVAGITLASVSKGEDLLGVSRGRLRAAIGPAIGPCCFEVGLEVIEGLSTLGLSDEDLGRVPGPRGRPHIDLRRANRLLLERGGLLPGNIELVGGCTYCDAERYDSYRRDGSESGRMRAVIGLALVLLAFLLPGCAAPAESPPDMQVLMAAAADSLDGGDGPGAESQLREALAQRPNDPLVHAQLARALHLQGRDREAVVEGRISVGLDPLLWESSYNLACHHTALGEYDAAIRWLQKALILGELEVEDVVSDLDLLPLRDDHRFAFYENTGVLSRAEEDVLVLPDRRVGQIGEPMTVSILVIALNRPLMSERLEVEVEFLSEWPSGIVIPVERSETFSTGESGGREYSQRSLQFTFVPLRAGFLTLGPFRVKQGKSVHYTAAPLVEFQDATANFNDPLVDERRERLFSSLDLGIREFFRAPSGVDGELALRLDSSQSRFERFRALQADALPDGIVLSPDAGFRSVFLQRGTEGLSHLLELR